MVKQAGKRARLQMDVGDIAALKSVQWGIHQRAGIFDGGESHPPCTSECRGFGIEGGFARNIGAPVAPLHRINAVGKELAGGRTQHGRNPICMLAHHAPQFREVALDVLPHIVEPALVEQPNPFGTAGKVQPHEEIDVGRTTTVAQRTLQHIRTAPFGQSPLDELPNAFQRLKVCPVRHKHHAAFGRVSLEEANQLQHGSDACGVLRPGRQRRHDRDRIVIGGDNNPLVAQFEIAPA
ncbi:hypothetical protein HRbin15_02696 [bacterium HR15]|nr:hypothetical protein HRbin15_02696 [bacterium HR15]